MLNMSTASGFEKWLIVFTSANVYCDSESPGKSVPLIISKTARIYIYIYIRLHAEEHMGKI